MCQRKLLTGSIPKAIRRYADRPSGTLITHQWSTHALVLAVCDGLPKGEHWAYGTLKRI